MLFLHLNLRESFKRRDETVAITTDVATLLLMPGPLYDIGVFLDTATKWYILLVFGRHLIQASIFFITADLQQAPMFKRFSLRFCRGTGVYPDEMQSRLVFRIYKENYKLEGQLFTEIDLEIVTI